MTHLTKQRSLMPVYQTIDWEGIRIKAHPVGWRGIPVLGWFLEKAPLFTGCRQVFCVHVEDSKKRKETIEIIWFYN